MVFFDQIAGPTGGRLLLVVLDLLLVLPISSLSLAQTTTSGGLAGVVTDPSGAVVPDADVEIKDDTKGTRQSTKTDREGAYRFFFLAPARYMLAVSHDGFRTESRAVNVLLGPPVSVNVTLQVAKASTSVSVTAEAPLIQAENGDVSTTMNQRQISEVPNPGNDLTYIAQTAPGAIMNTDGGMGDFSILGMPGTSNLFTLNGMNNNNYQQNTNNGGSLGMMLGQNEVQEATIISRGYSGQFGGAAGSSVNYLTKSGGNGFHGNAAYYWNGSALNANDWIDNAVGNPRPFDIANQWAGSVGGSIKKDKLFFFFDTEGMRVVLPNSLTVVLPSSEFETATMTNIDSIFPSTPASPSASHAFYRQMFDLYNNTPGASAAIPGNFDDSLGCNGWTQYPMGTTGLGWTDACAVHFLKNVDAPSSESMVSGRVDWNMNAADRSFLLVQYDHGQRAMYVDPISPLFNAFLNQPWWQGQLSETHTFGPTAANQFLMAGTYISQTQGVASPSQALAAFPTTLMWGNGNFSGLGGQDQYRALPSGSITTQYQISDDLVKTRGKHKLGLGVNFLRSYWTGNGYNFAGTGLLVPQSIGAFFNGGVDPANPGTDFTAFYQTYPTVTWYRFAFYMFGLYGQEEWHSRSNLTLTLALRADHQSNPVCTTRCFIRLTGPFNSVSHDPAQPFNQAILINQKQAYPNTDSIVWSPRFSFAWQPFGVSHNTVIRGGVGIFYDPFPGGTGAGFAFNPPTVNQYNIAGYNLAPKEANSLSQNAFNSSAEFSKAFATGETLAQIQAADKNFTPPTLQIPANTMHSSQYQKWSLQAQHSFGAYASLSIGYFGNHGVHELAPNVDVNAFGFGLFPKGKCSSPPVLPCADPRFGEITEFDTDAVSNYNGMVVSFEQRITRWGRGLFQANYTYGHALDEISNGGIGQFTFGSSLYAQDATNLRGSYGAAEYDARHSLNANYVWELPIKEALGGHGPDYLVNGWQLSGAIFARTGFPYTVIDFAETGSLVNNNFFGTIYAVPVAPLGPAGPCGRGAAIPASPVRCQPPQLSNDGTTPNPNARFVQSRCETGFNTGKLGPFPQCLDGTAVTFAQGRNRFRGPSYFNTDFAVMKNTKIPRWENATLGIGFQFFNFFNHANFAFPDNGSSDSGFGQIFYQEQAPTSILGSNSANVSPRMIQLRAQLKF